MGIYSLPCVLPEAGGNNPEFMAVIQAKLTRGLEAPVSQNDLHSGHWSRAIITWPAPVFILSGAAQRHGS